MEFYKDWNFWLSIVTAFVAVCALFQTTKQTRLSNKQHLFDRRIKAFTIVDGIYKLCRENYQYLSHPQQDTNYANDLNFIWLTNNSFMEEQANAIKHPLENPYKRDFLIKREELRNLATEMQLIFKGKPAAKYSVFIAKYENVLFKMYQYQIVLKHIEEENAKHPMEHEKLQAMFSEPTHRKELNDALEQLKEAYDAIDDSTQAMIRRQIKLI